LDVTGGLYHSPPSAPIRKQYLHNHTAPSLSNNFVADMQSAKQSEDDTSRQYLQ